MATPMRSSDFRSIVEPLYNESFDGVYEQRKDEWKQFSREERGINRSYQEEVVLYGMGAAPEIGDGQPVTYQSGGQLYVARCTFKVYGLAYALSKILVEDGDHIRVGNIFSKHLAQSMIETKETVMANHLNRAFTSGYNGGDGVPLISASHPVIGGNQSNLLASAANLSQTSLEQMLIQIRNAQDSGGKRIRIMPQKLVISPSNVFQAEVILKSALRSGTANNDINAIKSMGMLSGETAVVSRMTSTTAWFVKTDAKNGLKLMMRRNLERSMEGDFETDSVRYKATERFGSFWVDWRDLYGTPGV